MRSKPEAPTAGTPRLMSSEDELWEKALVEYLPRRGTKAREAAAKWDKAPPACWRSKRSRPSSRVATPLTFWPARLGKFVLVAVVAALILSFCTLFAAASAATGEHVTGWGTGNVPRDADCRGGPRLAMDERLPPRGCGRLPGLAARGRGGPHVP